MNFNDIEELFKRGDIRPQSKISVLEASLNILKTFKPKSILEIGFGKGDWSFDAALVLSDPELNIIGIENFSQINTGRELKTEEEFWPSTLIDLQGHVDKIKNDLCIEGNIKVIEGDVTVDFFNLLKKLNTKFDCIRIDCLCQHKEPIKRVLEACLYFTTPEFLLLVDDIGPDQCSSRFIACTDLIEEDRIEPLWYSSDEAAFVNYGFDTDTFISKFTEITPTYYSIRPPIYYVYNNHRRTKNFIRTQSK